jgi:hypothetical protein
MILDNNTLYPIIYQNTDALDFLRSNNDPWVGTPYQGYVYIDPKQKGAFGEMIVADFMARRGHTVLPRTNTGHDTTIDGIKVENKFSVANRSKKGIVQPNCFIFNHFSIGKDWERAILMGVNPNTAHLVWFTRDDLETYLLESKPKCFLSRGQGGAKGNNDDWLYNSKSKKKAWSLFINLPWVKSLDQW